MISPQRSALLLTSLLLAASTGNAATLHGRVKDQRCSVLSQVEVVVRPSTQQHAAERKLLTDDSGNYTVDLPAGDYQLCVLRDVHAAPVCSGLSVVGTGDMWITTQLRDAAPDLSNFGNHSY